MEGDKFFNSPQCARKILKFLAMSNFCSCHCHFWHKDIFSKNFDFFAEKINRLMKMKINIFDEKFYFFWWKIEEENIYLVPLGTASTKILEFAACFTWKNRQFFQWSGSSVRVLLDRNDPTRNEIKFINLIYYF